MDSTWWKSAQELDRDQRALIEIPTDVGNFLVKGPPGCGKTNILLLRASYLRSAGFGNCGVIVFTRTLREFIAAGSQAPKMLPPERIATHAAWVKRMLAELGRPFTPSRENLSHDEERVERHEALLDAVTTLGLSHSHYDSILLDEVQDYWACEVELMARLTRRLFAVGDNRQRIYDRNEGVQAALDVDCVVHELQYHYRMGPKICQVADRLLHRRGEGSLEEYCQYDDREQPSRVSVHVADDLEGQVELLVPVLERQLRAYPNDWLGVMAVRKTTRDRVAELLFRSGVRSHVAVQSESSRNRSFDRKRRVVVSTLHASKGAEFRSVHFMDAGDFPYFSREKAFTAITRAKTTLYVYHSGPLHGALESALTEPTVPDLEEIFL